MLNKIELAPVIVQYYTMEAIASRIKKVERVREEMMDRIWKLKKEIAMCVDELAMNEEVLEDIDTNLSNLKDEQVFLVKAIVVASAVKFLDSRLTDDDAYLYSVWEERIAEQSF